MDGSQGLAEMLRLSRIEVARLRGEVDRLTKRLLTLEEVESRARIGLHGAANDIERLQAERDEAREAAVWLGAKLARRETDSEWAIEATDRWPWLED